MRQPRASLLVRILFWYRFALCKMSHFTSRTLYNMQPRIVQEIYSPSFVVFSASFLFLEQQSSLPIPQRRTSKIAKSLTRKRVRRYGRQLLPFSPFLLSSQSSPQALFSLLLFLLLFFRLAIFFPSLLCFYPGMTPHSSRTGAVLDINETWLLRLRLYAEINVGK